MTDSDYDELCERTHTMLMTAQGNMTAYLEQKGMDPCPAIDLAAEMMVPAFNAWSEILGKIQEQNTVLKNVKRISDEILADLRTQDRRLDPEAYEL